MKRCPSCKRTFDDETLSFCPNDGSGLETDASTGAAPLMATMLATPSSLGGASFPPPPPSNPGSGSFNPPPPNDAWAPPSGQTTPSPAKSDGINKKLIFGGLGCFGLIAIVGLVGIIYIFAFSGASSKMNPYKGDLKELAPENIGLYRRVDVDVLGDRDKEELGAINDAISVAYKGATETEVEMLIGNYSTAKDAEAGLESFKNKQIGRGFSTDESGSKKIGWRTVGKRFIMSKDTEVGKAVDRYLPDNARLVLAQTATTTPEKSSKIKLVGWTNGSVVFVIAGKEGRAVYFEAPFDAAVK